MDTDKGHDLTPKRLNYEELQKTEQDWMHVLLTDLRTENEQLRAITQLTPEDIMLLLSWVDMRDLEYGGLSQEDIALQAKLQAIQEKRSS